jgi:hypothetical protein
MFIQERERFYLEYLRISSSWSLQLPVKKIQRKFFPKKSKRTIPKSQKNFPQKTKRENFQKKKEAIFIKNQKWLFGS